MSPQHLRAALLCAAATLVLTAPAQATAPFQGVHHVITTVNGLKVDQYRWYDSHDRLRTVSLKQEGNGNPKHGGYAIQMTYVKNDGKTVTVNAEDSSDGGFGYFVSHERYRDFTDGDNDTIANKIFHTDDSPLGLGFPVTGQMLNTANSRGGAHQFVMSYHHYGTITPIPKDADGNDVSRTPTDKTKLALYQMPVTITWVFQGGTDYPRIDYSIDLSQIAEPDRVNFDIRGPYGVMVFDNGADAVVDKVIWGDRYHFFTTLDPVTRNSGWDWSQRNKGGRYSALIAGKYEMGLYEPKTFKESKTADGFADERGTTSTAFNNGQGCAEGETQIIPCDFEWPYQSLQYSLPYVSNDDPNANNEPSNFKKMAWGSTAFYGTGKSLTRVFDTSNTSEPFKGWPATMKLNYSVCVVLGVTTADGLTRDAALARNNCATTLPD
jgi:hypothetical protein